MASKNCSRCNDLFECSCETAGCWCESLYIDLDTLNELKEDYDNCLCPSCLEKYTVMR